MQVKVLTEEQKEKIRNLTDPSELPAQERRMQYAALDRAFTEPGVDPALLAKYHAAAGSHKKKLLGSSYRKPFQKIRKSSFYQPIS